MDHVEETLNNINLINTDKPEPVFKCAECKDTMMIPDNKGGSTHCFCFFRAQATKVVGEKFIKSKLRNFHPFNQSQVAALDAVKKNPGGSFFFCGETGSGKTHLLSALYLESYRKITRDKVVHYTDDELMEALVNKAYARKNGAEEAHQPLALTQSIKDGDTLEMFWDDLGQINTNPFTLSLWFSVLNALDNRERRLVVTSNFTVDELKDPNILGRGQLRRITDKCVVLEMNAAGRSENFILDKDRQ